jgi:hypothetical protein
MFKYRYIICTKPVKTTDKFWIRKLIFYEDKLYQKEDNKYSKNQIFKLIKSISENDYSKIDNNTLPK